MLDYPAEHLFVPLDLQSIHIVGYADAAFANNGDISSQLRFIELLKYKYENAYIIHYVSWKCKRVTRSVLGAEVYAFSHCLDFVLVLVLDLSSILSRKVSTVVFKDSRCLFTAAKKRPLIDIAAIRENYSIGDLTNVAHVASRYNLANAFTEASADRTILRNVMKTGRLDHPVNQCILPQ